MDLDDIIIFNEIEAEHREHVRKILSILKAQKLYAKKSEVCILSEVGEIPWPCDLC